jgi:hypothetical protein
VRPLFSSSDNRCMTALNSSSSPDSASKISWTTGVSGSWGGAANAKIGNVRAQESTNSIDWRDRLGLGEILG